MSEQDDNRTINKSVEDRLYSILYESKCRNFVEGTEFGGVTIPLIKLKKQQVYIYGCGESISTLILYLKQNDIDVKGIFDRNIEKTKIRRMDGVPIMHTSQIGRIPDPENTFVVINTNGYRFGLQIADIINLLRDAGISNYCTLTDRERRLINGTSFCDYLEGMCIEYFREHYEELKNLLCLLKDDTSKEVLLEWLKVFFQRRAYRLDECDGRHKYFYGLPKKGGIEALYTHKDDEVWLNCGANIGDTIFLYFANGLKADIIYAVEGDEECYRHLCHNLDRLPSPYREKVVPINEFIDSNTDFENMFAERKISLINADIQGNELNLLRDCSELIIRDRPVLAICVYHKISDLFVLTEQMKKDLTEYSFVLRKYPGEDKNSWWELVMYAIPNERFTEEIIY